MFGRVTRFSHGRGYGFILGEDGNTYFIHVSKLYGEYLDRGNILVQINGQKIM